MNLLEKRAISSVLALEFIQLILILIKLAHPESMAMWIVCLPLTLLTLSGVVAVISFYIISKLEL